MKFCKDCKHYNHYTAADTCTSPNLPTDLVTGSPKFTLCKEQRYPDSLVIGMYGFTNVCGEKGEWFEQKVFEPTNEEDADLDDLSAIPFGR